MDKHQKRWVGIAAVGSMTIGAISLAISALPDSIGLVDTFAKDYIRVAGLVLTLAGLVLAVRRLQDLPDQVEQIRSEVEKLSNAEAHGHSILRLSSVGLFASEAKKDLLVATVCKRALKIAQSELDMLSSSVVAYYENDGDMVIEEGHVISDVLHGLIEMLPQGYQWWGITRLASGWSDAADPSFAEFSRLISRKAASKSLSVRRIFALPHDATIRIQNEMKRQCSSGIEVRWIQDDAAHVRDISIVMGPDGKLVYAMEFSPIGHASLQNMRVFGRNSTHAQRLKGYFDGHWSQAQIVS